MKMTWKMDSEGNALLSDPPGFSIALARTGRGRFYTLWRHKDRIKQLGPVPYGDQAGKDAAIADLKALASEASKTPASSTRR